jgi:hypothetical protein
MNCFGKDEQASFADSLESNGCTMHAESGAHLAAGVVKSWSCAAKAFIAFLLMGTLVF